MTGTDLLRVLTRSGVRLYLDQAGALRYSAAAGVYSAEWRAVVAVHREKIIAALRPPEPPPTPPFSARCADCGATDRTVYLGLADGTLLCRRCWTARGAEASLRRPAPGVAGAARF